MTERMDKPPGLSSTYATQFQDGATVRAYRHREPYPPETFQILRELAQTDEPIVLELGCGTGDLTVGLSELARHIDAIDFSDEALAEAKTRIPRDNVSWISSPVETARFAGPYDMVTAAQSLHWMDWPVVFAKLKPVLRPGRFVTIVSRDYASKRWWTPDFQTIVDKHSTNRDFKPYDLVAELEQRGHLKVVGERTTAPIAFRQTAADLVEAFHSRNGFSRDRMGQDQAAAFDHEATRYLEEFAEDGLLNLGAVGRVTWGTIC